MKFYGMSISTHFGDFLFLSTPLSGLLSLPNPCCLCVFILYNSVLCFFAYFDSSILSLRVTVSLALLFLCFYLYLSHPFLSSCLFPLPLSLLVCSHVFTKYILFVTNILYTICVRKTYILFFSQILHSF